MWNHQFLLPFFNYITISRIISTSFDSSLFCTKIFLILIPDLLQPSPNRICITTHLLCCGFVFFYLLLYFLFKMSIKLFPDKQEIHFPSPPFSFESRYLWFSSATSMHFTWSPVKAAQDDPNLAAKWDKNTLPLSCQQAKEMLAAAFPHLPPTTPQPLKTWVCLL